MDNEIIERKRRLFFALRPDEGLHKALTGLINQFPNTQSVVVKDSNLHLALAFLGMLNAADQQQCVKTRAAGVPVHPFKFRLSEYGYFAKPRITYIAPKCSPKLLEKLVGELGKRLVDCDITVNFHDFRPHVTLLRRSRKLNTLPNVHQVDCIVERFVLHESVPHPEGVEYRVLQEY